MIYKCMIYIIPSLTHVLITQEVHEPYVTQYERIFSTCAFFVWLKKGFTNLNDYYNDYYHVSEVEILITRKWFEL